MVRATGRRLGLNMISAVSARGDFRFMLHEGSVTATVFRTFPRRLMANAKQPVFLVVDGHPIHKAQLLSYMKLLDVPLGLLINFKVQVLKDGIKRVAR